MIAKRVTEAKALMKGLEKHIVFVIYQHETGSG